MALVIRSAVIVLGGDPGRFPLGFNPDAGCRDIGYSCGVANNIVMTFLTLAFGLSLFLFYRMRRVRQEYVTRARKQTAQLVQTSGTIIGDIVGREEICHVLMDDLRDRGNRRPHVVLGGVGVGKTAVLFRLTKLLAEKGAVPVPLGLRQAQTDVDFVRLARERFIAEAATASLSTTDAERVWAELRKDDQIVVLADGLEEALSGADSRSEGNGDGGASTERDNRVRVAVRAARRQQLPLVIASRPHDALSGLGLDAAVIELEPLGEEAALEYIEEGAPAEDALRLDWVIETAEVTDTPFYLQIARELHQKGLLGRAQPERSRLNTRGLDRAALRFRLLDTWTRALIEGHFEPELPIPKELREATVAQLSALALMGLKDDRLEARFGDLLKKDAESDGYVHELLIGRLRDTITHYRDEQDPAAKTLIPDIEREIQLAATRGLRLRLVEPCGNGVRFPHSIMQAYLASREIRQVVKEQPAYLDKALENPGRELLLALVMDSRRDARPPRSHAMVRDKLLAVGCRSDLEMGKRLDALAAALEIDSVDVSPAQQQIARTVRKIWPPASEDQTVEEAKLRAVARFGAAARRIAERRAKRKVDEPEVPAAAFHDLFRIARKDSSYRVRLAAAQELGAGGEEAMELLRGYLRPPRPRQALDETSIVTTCCARGSRPCSTGR